MENDEKMSENSISKIVEKPEIGIREEILCNVEETMKNYENIRTENSIMEVTNINDDLKDKNEKFKNIENNISSTKIVDNQESKIIINDDVSDTTKNVIISDDKNVDATIAVDEDATMEIVDPIVGNSKNLSIPEIEINEKNENREKNEHENENVSCVLIETEEKNVKMRTTNVNNLEKFEESNEIEAEEKTQEKTVTSLSSIALAYDNSDSESEQIDSTEKNCADIDNDMEIQITKEYRTVAVTSDEESDSSSSSSSSDSSDSSSDEESDDSDEAEKSSGQNNARKNKLSAHHERESKSEFDDLPPIEDLKISVPEVLCDPLGEVAWMVEQMVVVRPKPGKPTLNLDTILFVERGRRVLGRIFDVFGQVSDPHYCVRFNSTEHIKESDIKVGMTAYFCPNTEYTSVVFVQDLLKMKATDDLADDEHPEFSDDEEERAYYAALKQKQKSEKAKTTTEDVPQKRQRTGKDPGWKSNNPWSSGRKQEQSKKSEENYNSPGRPGNTPRNSRNQSNLWQQPQYPAAYQNISWPQGAQSYQDNNWQPQNPYGYSEQFENRHQPENPRAFFRPPHNFQNPPNSSYMSNSHYSPQPNRCRFPGVNFPWQSPIPRTPNFSWRFSNPPPPPPPPGI